MSRKAWRSWLIIADCVLILLALTLANQHHWYTALCVTVAIVLSAWVMRLCRPMIPKERHNVERIDERRERAYQREATDGHAGWQRNSF